METGSKSLVLTSEYFKVLMDNVLNQFMKLHKLSILPKTYQLYGYGNFDEKKVSLKKDFEAFGSEFINGKYLYDKNREQEKGKELIKISQFYTNILLQYIGFDQVTDFLEQNKLSDQEHQKQLLLINTDEEKSISYYVNYYFGEDDTIFKGQSIIYNNWKKIKHTFIYPQKDGTLKTHFSQGNVKRQGDTIIMRTNTLSGNRYIEGASEIYYMGHKSSSDINYLIGTYCTFDIYTNTVAGRSILEKCGSKEEMELKSESSNIPAYIAMEIRNERIINSKSVPKSELELSSNSPYASLYEKLPGTYKLTFNFENGFKESLQFKILPTNYKILPLTENVYIEKDRFKLLNKGSVINFRFSFSGIIALERVNIFIKTYFLKNDDQTQAGVFSGIDNENRLVNGSLLIQFQSEGEAVS